jgi:hypothetical protein
MFIGIDEHLVAIKVFDRVGAVNPVDVASTRRLVLISITPSKIDSRIGDAVSKHDPRLPAIPDLKRPVLA